MIGPDGSSTHIARLIRRNTGERMMSAIVEKTISKDRFRIRSHALIARADPRMIGIPHMNPSSRDMLYTYWGILG
jgi:hypothetical protein